MQPCVLSHRARIVWRIIQGVLWLGGALLIVALLLWPRWGIMVTWNILIPVAPALLAFAPGLWRNVCPLGTTALLPQHLGVSAGRKISPEWQGRLNLAGIAALLLIVPLRHAMLNTDGTATAIALMTVGICALLMGVFFECKSGWCSGLCPVHPVEKLYGTEPMLALPNAHCTQCLRCTAPCPDSTPGIHPMRSNQTLSRTLAGLVMVGGFPGYIWGWFQVRDYAGAEGWRHLGPMFTMPFLGLAATLAAFLVLRRALPDRFQARLVRIFAASAISCYYWYRVPMLFGFGTFPDDGVLVDLRATLPDWFPLASRMVSTSLFFWWLVGRMTGLRSWCRRPAFAPDVGKPSASEVVPG